MRKPHVFVSSRLKLSKIRLEIKTILEESGFSVEIYENESTPSNEPATYLKDIARADFVIFVFNETYGTLRPKSGRSGVHDEWLRVLDCGIPNHVYLKRQKGDGLEPKQKQFIHTELEGREISYFYYASTASLLRQVRLSIAKLGLDIARSPNYSRTQDRLVLMATLVERDRETACDWERTFDRFLEFEATLALSNVSDVWAQLADHYDCFDPQKSAWPFLDSGLQERFAEIVTTVTRLAQSYSSQTAPDPLRFWEASEIKTPIGPLRPNVTTLSRRLPQGFHDSVHELKKQLKDQWTSLAALAQLRYTRHRF